MSKRTQSLGAFEAKTRLSELLELVGRGASFTITKHDKPVARLVGYSVDVAARRKEAVANLLEARAKRTLGELSVRSLREEGRA